MGAGVRISDRGFIITDQGRTFAIATSWTFLAITSTAGATERERKDPGDGVRDPQ